LRITRREFVVSTGALVAAVSFLTSVPLALAQTVEELMRPGPLPDLVEGKADAPVTIIEYASMTCPHCAAFATETYPKLKANYIDTGKVKYIFREFPLDDLAMAAAMLARCAGKTDQKRSFDLIEMFFDKQRDWVVQRPIEPIKNLIKQVGLTEKDFEACLNDRDLSAKILQEQERASKQLGVNSTPTFFINGQLQKGAMSFDELEKVLKPLLNT